MNTVKQLLILGALAIMAAACQREPVPPQEATVTFRVALPEVTRAAGDGSRATALTLRIYDADGQFLQELTPDSFTPSVSVLPGTYSFCFWATSPDADAYSFDGQVLTVDYTRMTMNSDAEDAFWACVPNLTVSPGFTQDVTLSRPLGQVSLYSKGSDTVLTASDLGDADKYVSSLTLQGPGGSGIPTEMNLLTGATAAPVAQVAFPDSPLQLQTMESSATDGTLLAYAYVLAEGEITLPQVAFSATLKRTQTTITAGSVSNVPLQRNRRTRLLSQQLAPPTISFKDGQGSPQDDLDDAHPEIIVHLTAESGTTIYYTTDGTTPTENSYKYGDPFPVSSVCTINAVAMKAGCTTSETATAYVQKHLVIDMNELYMCIQAGLTYCIDSYTILLDYGENTDIIHKGEWNIHRDKPFSVSVESTLLNPYTKITKIVLYAVNPAAGTHFYTICDDSDYQDYDEMQVVSNQVIWTGRASSVTIYPDSDYSCSRIDIWYSEIK
ncbi:MAG: chitobiase/beta-hexosaminidase C-terminal domain-containing protein [Bacteroidales bacterium]|nr:chitobiase/beta-hexosaminidase C-terminal domain-containing protein [Bacteroidales bacterium]